MTYLCVEMLSLIMETNIVLKLFLRLGLGAAFLSACADRFGMWDEEVSAWGDMNTFLIYTQQLIPWAPDAMIPVLGWIATLTEVILGIFLILGFKTELSAKCSGVLLLIFALSMLFFLSAKSPFDYSVFAASGAAFALGLMKKKYFEIDNLLSES